jgi:hypothetical protein
MIMKAQLIALLLVLNSAALIHADITLKVADTKAAAGGEVDVPILISGSQTVGPIQFMIDYDPRLLEAMTDPPDAEPKNVVFGKVVKGGTLAQNPTGRGEWKIALRTDEPITQDGELLRLRFRVKGKKGDSCTLALDAAEAWEKESLFQVRVATQPGVVTIAGGGLPLWALIAAVLAVLVLAGFLFFVVRRKRDGALVDSPAQTTTASPPAVAAQSPSSPASSAPPGADDVMAKLKKLKDMQEAGLISAEDFERKKSDLLERM